jgi:hypothetical protein
MTESIRTSDKNGTRWTLLDGTFHREDGPAIERDDTDEWWVNGKRHRLDGPAVIEYDQHFTDPNGNVQYEAREWWVNGVRHREDGPAVIRCERLYDDDDAYEGNKSFHEWWIDGEQLTTPTEELKAKYPIIYEQLATYLVSQVMAS